jgi:hypothetical protein
MDNRINETRRKISLLRAEMVRVEDTMRDQIRQDLDSTHPALRLMEMRKELAALVADWGAAGGNEHLPSRSGSRQTTGRLPSQRPRRTTDRGRRAGESDDPLPLRILELRAQISELSSTIRQLQLSGLDAAAPRLLISRKRAELEDLTRRTNDRSQGD